MAPNDHDDNNNSCIRQINGNVNKRQRKSNNRKQAQNQQPRFIQAYIPTYLRPYVQPYHGDFCYSTCFQPKLIVQLMVEGFLPIACPGILLPKLHNERCVIRLPGRLHTSKSVRKKSKRFCMTINKSFDEVVANCHRQHGSHCWLYPELVAAFRSIHQRESGYPAIVNVTNSDPPEKALCQVRMYSIEVWSDEDELVAGELGYTVGSIYTSLTGFTAQDSAGSVQLAALGKLLIQSNFEVWDLGMEMEYKVGLGAEVMPRDEFVETVHRVRRCQRQLRLPTDTISRINCRTLLDSNGNVESVLPASGVPAKKKRQDSA